MKPRPRRPRGLWIGIAALVAAALVLGLAARDARQTGGSQGRAARALGGSRGSGGTASSAAGEGTALFGARSALGRIFGAIGMGGLDDEAAAAGWTGPAFLAPRPNPAPAPIILAAMPDAFAESDAAVAEAKDAYDRAMRIESSDPESRRLLAEAVTRDPRSVPALSALARAHLDDGEYNAAVRLASQCEALDPGNVGCSHVLVGAFGRQGLHDEMLPYLDACLARDPSDIACLGPRATYDIRHNDFEGAAELVTRLRAADATSAGTLIVDGDLHYARGDLQGACPLWIAACGQGDPNACNRQRQYCPQ